MGLKIEYVEGPTINECYFVGIEKTAAGEEQKWAVRASWMLDPKLHAAANTDDDKDAPKLEVQPEQIIEEISKTATDLESFKTTTAQMAVAIHEAEGVSVTATEEGPVWSVEDQEKGKVAKEPVVSMESGLSDGKVEMVGGSKVAGFYGRLPKKSIGAPQIALDLQSKVATLEGQLKVVQAEKEVVEKERDDAKQEAGTIKKSVDAEGVLKILEKMGLVEDEKDKEEFKAKLAKVDGNALKVLEEILKQVDSGGKSGDKPKGGSPFPPKKPEGFGGGPKAPAKPGGAEGIFSSDDNVIQGSLSTELDSLAEISRKWIAEDNRKRGMRQ